MHRVLLIMPLLLGWVSLSAHAELYSPKIVANRANAQAPANQLPKELEGVGITEHLGGSVSIKDLEFKDESGQAVKLEHFFSKKKPVLLTLVYYQCPNLCNFLLNGLLDGLKQLNWTPGQQFELVSVSIDPKEGPELAAKKKKAYLSEYKRPAAEAGWHFLTGEESQIKRLASEVGFGYRYNQADQQFAHSAAIFILTPEGKISRYLYGVAFSERDLKLALLEASNGRIGTVVERFLLFCYRFDPHTRKYSVYLTRVMQAGGAATILIFGGWLVMFWRRQRKLEG